MIETEHKMQRLPLKVEINLEMRECVFGLMKYYLLRATKPGFVAKVIDRNLSIC